MKLALMIGVIGLSLIDIFLQSCTRIASSEECGFFKAKIVQIGSDQLSVETEGGIGTYSYQWSTGAGDFPSIAVDHSGSYEVTVTDHGTKCTAKAQISYTLPDKNGCGSFTAVSDKDNNLYDIVTIGTQCWMKSNVNLESGISKITDPTEWGATTKAAWSYYENDPGNGTKYNKLYNWYAAKSGLLCPDGWRIPSLSDWEILFTTLQGDSLASIAMRKIDPLWLGSVHANNASGFSALPGGRRQAGGSFIFEGTEADFWAIDESSIAGSARAITIKSTYDGITKIDWGKNHGFSCRCIKN